MQISTPIGDNVYYSFTDSPLHTLQSPLYSTRQPISDSPLHYRQPITLSLLQTVHYTQPVTDSPFQTVQYSPLHSVCYRLAHFRQSITLSLLQTTHFRQSTTLSLLQTAHFRPSISDSPLHSVCLLYTSPSPRDWLESRMPSSA